MNAERKNIIQPATWWRAFEAEAARRNITLAAFAGEAMRAALPTAEAAKLAARPGRGKPPKRISDAP